MKKIITLALGYCILVKVGYCATLTLDSSMGELDVGVESVVNVTGLGVVDGREHNLTSFSNNTNLGYGISFASGAGDSVLINHGLVLGGTNLFGPSGQRFFRLGNGVDLNSGGTVSITNSGHISGNATFTGGEGEYYASGNGIQSRSAYILNRNSGVISGKGSIHSPVSGLYVFTYSSNGLWDEIETIRNNSGRIAGEIDLSHGNIDIDSSGNGIYSSSLVVEEHSGTLLGKIVVNGSELTHPIERSGNAVFNRSEGEVKILNNSGLLIGEVSLKGGSDGGKLYLKDSGNSIYNDLGDINVENNRGIISGYSQLTGAIRNPTGHSGNGLLANKKKTIVNNNSGIISGDLHVEFNNPHPETEKLRPDRSGVGVYGYTGVDVKNSGLIRGSTSFYDANGSVFSTTDANSGVGIGVGYYYKGRDVSIKNSGTIVGSQKSIKATSANSTSTITNYGILAGVVHGTGDAQYNNFGIEVNLLGISIPWTSLLVADEAGTVESLNIATGGTLVDGRTVYNVASQGGIDSYEVITTSTNYMDRIINGAGVAKGTLAINGTDVTMKNSIVNGYKTAITFDNGGSLVATDTTFNGGGVRGKDAVIKGLSGGSTLSLAGRSVVNGFIDLGAGDDVISLASTTQINGDIIGGAGNDILNLGGGAVTAATTDSNGDGVIDRGDIRGLSVFYSLSDFEDIQIEGNVTLYETARIDSGNVSIKAGNSLGLRLDPTKTDSRGRVTGHALYGGNVVVATEKNTIEVTEYETDGGALKLSPMA